MKSRFKSASSQIFYFLLIVIFFFSGLQVEATTKPRDPEFLGEIQNQTVSEGRTVRFACRVDYLGPHKLAWIHFENSAILTVANHVITRNDRISVTHDKHQKTWYLHIADVKESDTGKYMCQINTATAMTMAGYLTVVVPPDIVDTESSGDVIAQEGNDVKLRCKARGSPKPVVTWKREDGCHISVNKSVSLLEHKGELLTLSKVSRMDMGAYLCIASNGYPPIVSKRILVSVDFPPMLWIPHQLIASTRGSKVTLECYTEAHPTSLNYWTRGDNNMIYDSEKYHIQNKVGSPDYKIHMLLTINNLESDDFTTYRCVAKNPRGETDGAIKIYDSGPPPTTTPSPTPPDEVLEDINNQVLDNASHQSGKGQLRPEAVSDTDENNGPSRPSYTGSLDFFDMSASAKIDAWSSHFMFLWTLVVIFGW